MERISRNQIKQTSIQQLESIDQYDMYIIEFELLNGEKRKLRAFAEKNTFPEIGSNEWNVLKQNRKGDIYTFFISRLLDEDGLLKKQKRNDYIYLGGDFRKNGKIASRNMKQSNGKTGQENFDAKLFDIKLKCEIRENENTKQSNSNGKHYVISDIHGMYGSYKAVMKELKKDDELYILGDVIDRGDEGIKILQDIIRRKNNSYVNPKIHFLLGNHEAQFLSVLKMMKDYKLTEDDIIIMYLWKIYTAHLGNAQLDGDKEKIEEFSLKKDEINKKYEKLKAEKGIKDSNRDYLYMWLYKNKGLQTFIKYLELPEEEQQNIYDFLYNSNVIMAKQIQNQNYIFVHATPSLNREILAGLKNDKKSYKIFELEWFDRKCMLETRDNDENYMLAKEENFITICGHDPSIGCIVNNDTYNYIRIDAGCGHGSKKGAKLALYCIEDDKVKYIEEMKSIGEYR